MADKDLREELYRIAKALEGIDDSLRLIANGKAVLTVDAKCTGTVYNTD